MVNFISCTTTSFKRRYLRGLAFGLRVVESICPKASMHLVKSWSVIFLLQSRVEADVQPPSSAAQHGRGKGEQWCQVGNPPQLQSIAALPASGSHSKLRVGGLGNCSPCSAFQWKNLVLLKNLKHVFFISILI